ncbi:kunitz-type protease inhibitor 1-like isoform X2 [Conger conger]|uniref:kunitz-type protease inhibitor 1-like isoform X2 n=1 Tax=Conger conger TaxID=82655 RepID=UPI002A5AC096|nr:kunitz-type protease inhibitor 1-like isoform X2 [Conger conger]
MPPFLIGLFLSASLLLQIGCPVRAQECSVKYQGREDFVLEANESVKNGGEFFSSPNVQSVRECLNSCCKNPNCDLALIEKGPEADTIKACFLFICVYKQKYACRFVKKKGFSSYILSSVFAKYLGALEEIPGDEDKHPIANGGPARVMQPGQVLMLNGLESRDDKAIISYKWSLLKGDSSAVIKKTAMDDQVMVTNLKSGVYVFQLIVTDSIGQSDTTQVKVHVLDAEESDSYCRAPLKIGPCRAAFPRWYYDLQAQDCKQFLFGGCRGNQNNYLYEKECSTACDGIAASASRSAPLPKGEVCGAPCEAEQFNCGDNCCVDGEPECDNVNQCSNGVDEKACRNLNLTFGRLLVIPVSEVKARCTEPPETGPCRASMSRWYYDPLQGKCLRFNFGGCRGNENNFAEEDSCMNTCRSVTDKDVFTTYVAGRSGASTDKGTAVIAVVLAVAILILLAVLGYCFVKRKKEPPRPPVAGATPVSTTEDTECLVYNSTTKPI